MRFDEEVMRRQFYWNLFDPYFTNTNGNSRLDLYLKMQVIAHFYYQSFPIPQIDDQMSLKLEDIISNLLIDTKNAHDALADCEFLIHLIKSISEKLPKGRFLQDNELPKKISSSLLKDNKGRDFKFVGLPDLVIEFEDKTYGIIDFKTTKISEKKADFYKFQLA